MNKKKRLEVRREVAFWQRGAIALIALLVIFAFYAAHLVDQMQGRKESLERELVQLQTRYEAAQEIGSTAVARLGSLQMEFDEYRAQVEQDRIMEEAERAQAMANYEALGIYQYIGECTLTAYCCESKGNPHICGTGTGLTASGLPVAPGMVAVDPSIIPLGSTVIINGISYLAADTGVTGYHIDIAIQTHEEADAFGVSSAEVWIIPPGGDENGK